MWVGGDRKFQEESMNRDVQVSPTDDESTWVVSLVKYWNKVESGNSTTGWNWSWNAFLINRS